MEVERSFWEKATILHAEYHRPAGTADARSVLSPLRGHGGAGSASRIGAAAIDQHDLRERVVAWKGQFFGSAWAKYDLAKPGTFRLVPPAERRPALKRDYEAMSDMYLSEPAAFDEVLAVLEELEQRINMAGKNRTSSD